MPVGEREKTAYDRIAWFAAASVERLTQRRRRVLFGDLRKGVVMGGDGDSGDQRKTGDGR